jgi:hypothetical protein
MAMGREKYGHGVRVDDDTTTWGTKTDSWMTMATEEFLDAIIYVTADYIRTTREPDTGKMSSIEMKYMEHRRGFTQAEDLGRWMKDNPLTDDNELIGYIIDNWRDDLEPCRHKVLLCTLINTLGLSEY